MCWSARTCLALGLALAGLGAASARPAPDFRDPAARAASGLKGLVQGPVIRPGALVIADEAGRLRTLELDDLAPLRLRITVPF